MPTDVDVSTWKTRIELYQASQKPVDLMRYPLAVKKNNNDVRREGLQWFSLFSTPKKSEKKNENAKGLQSLSVGSNNYRGQVLPELNLAGDDFLYGYDVIPCEGVVGNNKKTCYERLEQFDPAKHCGNGSRGENTSPNRNFRQENRKERH